MEENVLENSKKEPNILKARLLLIGSSLCLTLVMLDFALAQLPNESILPKTFPRKPLDYLLFVFLAAALVLFVLYRKELKKSGPKKTGVAALIISIAVAASGLTAAIAMKPISQGIVTQQKQQRHDELNSALKKYVKDDWSSTGAKLPDNPKIVKYNLDKMDFNYDIGYRDDNTYYAETPEEANVVMAYKYIDSSKDADYVYLKTGEYAGTTYRHTVKLYALRLDDWSLIEETEIYHVDGTKPGEVDADFVYQNSKTKVYNLLIRGSFYAEAPTEP